MAFYNLPPIISTMLDAIDKRLTRLERAIRFSAPPVATDPTYPTQADIIYNTTTNLLKYWNGSAWVIIADSNVGSQKIPFTSTWTGTGLAFTGTPATGYYIKIGKMIFFTINVSCSNVTNFGTGNYSLTLPFAPDNDYMTNNGGVHKNSDHYQIGGDMNGGSTTMPLFYLSNNGSNSPMKYNQPVALTTASYFYISGTYFVA